MEITALRFTRKSYGAATFVFNGAAFHHMCRSYRTVSLSSCVRASGTLQCLLHVKVSTCVLSGLWRTVHATYTSKLTTLHVGNWPCGRALGRHVISNAGCSGCSNQSKTSCWILVQLQVFLIWATCQPRCIHVTTCAVCCSCTVLWMYSHVNQLELMITRT